ncbi:MAG: hypothetical protein U0232_23270 [Thermomicrobiales bacterium]
MRPLRAVAERGRTEQRQQHVVRRGILRVQLEARPLKYCTTSPPLAGSRTAALSGSPNRIKPP